MVVENYESNLLEFMPKQTIEDIVAAIEDGAETPADVMGFDAPALNSIERMAHGYYRARVYDRAAMIYGFLIRLEPKRGSAWRGLGAVCHAGGKYVEAVRCYRQAVRHDSTDVPSRVFWGECLCAVGERKNGLELLQDVLKEDTEAAEYKPYIARARAIVEADGGIPPRVVLVEKGAALAAEAGDLIAAGDFGFAFAGGAEDSPEDGEISPEQMLEDPKIYEAIQHLKERIEAGTLTYKEVGGFTENEMDGAYICACKYTEMGQLLEAMQITGYLMFLDPYGARYYQLVGICLQRMKQYDVAEHYYSMAHTLDKEDPMTQVYRGESMIMAGNIDNGLGLVAEGALLGADKPEHREVLDRAAVLQRQFAR